MSAPELVLLFKILIKFFGSLLIFFVVMTVLANFIFGDAYDRLMHHPEGRTKSPSSNSQTPKD